MARIVTALFASRAEAEAARARLAATVKVESARVVGQDTAGALVGLPIEAGQLDALRAALGRGDHVVVASVARGADQERIVEALGSAAPEEAREEGPRLSYSIGPAAGARTTPPEAAPQVRDRHAEIPAPAARPTPNEVPATPPQAQSPLPPPAPASAPAVPPVDRFEPRPVESASDEVRVGATKVYRRGGERDEQSGEFESRMPARRLTDEEVSAGGLLKDRVIEVVEMREEPVISREVVVREEVVIRKTTSERSKIVTDTVRRTEVEVDDLAPPK